MRSLEIVWSNPFIVEMTELKQRGTLSAPGLPSSFQGHEECLSPPGSAQFISKSVLTRTGHLAAAFGSHGERPGFC